MDSSGSTLNSNLNNKANNSDIGGLANNISAITDCNLAFKSNGVSILRWGIDTLNTPYKQGMYGTNQGFIFDFTIAGTYRSQIAVGTGSSIVTVRSGASGSWSDWQNI